MKSSQSFSVIFALAVFIIVVLAVLFTGGIKSEYDGTVKDINVIYGADGISKSYYNLKNTVVGSPGESFIIPEVNPGNVETAEPIQNENADTTISFIAAGDNLIHQNIIDYARVLANEYNIDSEYFFDPIYDNVRDIIESADIALVNQEGPIAGKELKGFSGYPTFNAPDEAGDALVNLGFDIVNIANNHMLDRGERGYEKSIEFWQKQPVTLIGGYVSKEDFENIRYIDYNGVRIAFISYTYGTNNIYLPKDSTMWVPYYFEEDFVHRHSKEARENADIVIAVMHWGTEHVFSPNKQQLEYTEILVNNNVDVIIGIHPHVLQPIEWKCRPDGKRTLVAYSIGNMMSSMRFPKNMVGGFLSFNIDYTDRSNIYITNVKIIPTMCYYSMDKDDVTVFEFIEFPRELYATHGSRLNEDVAFETIKSYITNTISPEFLPDDFLKKINN